ncbi:hypothetical protein C8R44DRAFT_795044 [Mycena epipterygia]|nr:hypothetical protein C8R44DRAFT_795044 [Mycena epipterygia]
MPAPVSPPLDGTLGALEIGTFVGTFLFGILTLQTFNYYRQFPKDSKTLKITIAVLWLLEFAHTLCSLQGIYVITVTFYGQPPIEIIVNPPQTHIITILFSGGIDAIVQIFFGNRIRVLSGRSYVFFLCIGLAALRLACDVVLMSSFWKFKEGYAVLQTKEHWAVIMAETVSPVGDFLIALSMCYCLWQVRNSEFSRTRSMVDTLMIWTFETTIITSGAGIMQLVLFLTRKDLAFVALFLVQPKLFSNGMLASVNGRSRFRVANATFVESQDLAFGSSGTGSRSRTRREDEAHRMRNVVVHIAPTGTTTDEISQEKTEAV